MTAIETLFTQRDSEQQEKLRALSEEGATAPLGETHPIQVVLGRFTRTDGSVFTTEAITKARFRRGDDDRLRIDMTVCRFDVDLLAHTCGGTVWHDPDEPDGPNGWVEAYKEPPQIMVELWSLALHMMNPAGYFRWRCIAHLSFAGMDLDGKYPSLLVLAGPCDFGSFGFARERDYPAYTLGLERPEEATK